MFEMQDVGKVFVQGHVLKRKSRVVHKINLMVNPGETLGLIGPSGAGKSTIGKLAVGLMAPSEGRLLFQDRDISHPNYQLSRWLKKKMQIIFQDPQSSLHPGMKIGNLLKEPLRLHRLVSRSKEAGAVKAQLARVGLDEDILDRYPAEVSGGEKQRIAIARVMALNPSFVVLDEPTSMLDVSAQANILHLLMALQRDRGMAYLYISHDIRLVAAFCQRVAVVSEGRIVEQGPVNKVMTDPRHPCTRQLLAADGG